MGLGDKLREAIDKLQKSRHVDKDLVKEVIKELQRALIASDVEIALVLELSKHVEEEAFKELPEGINRKEHIVKTAHDALVKVLGGIEQFPPKEPKRILLTGLFGSGKTTTSGKIGKYYKKRGKKVGVIAADTYRPAAHIQLKTLAEQAGLSFYGNENEKKSHKIVEEGLKALEKEKIDLIIVDSAGRSGLDEHLTKELIAVNEKLNPDYSFLVISADIGQIAKKQAIAFNESIGINGVIITKMDGSAKGGGALAACGESKSPVYFIGTGEKLDDFQEFDATRFLSRIMGYGDLQALLEKVKEVEVKEQDVEAVLQGKFNLQIFYDQLKAARSMGPLGKVMEMLGMSQKLPKEAMEIGEQKLDSYKVIMDSMTKQEKIDPELINSSRIERIAKGSGKKTEEVRDLIKQYKQMKTMFRSLKNLNPEQMQEGKEFDMSKVFGKGMKKKLSKKKFKLR
ncbi:MAG TPA: signal recognition particle receptor subunit alpha [archaeon]|nr:signal recognition particle receptor subunit alpha [archaeon]